MNVIEAQDVTKVFGKGRVAVRSVENISLTVEKGEVILIMGPSGSGKTTLISMVGALLKPTSGNIKVDGVKITDLSEKQLPKVRLENFGFVFQNFNLLSSLTALENVELALNLAGVKGEQATRRANEFLVILGLKDRLDHVPADLSGGEKQRVSIARALVNNPKVILADEPTANLDSKTGHEVTELLCRIACEQDRSVVIVSHDERIKGIANRVLYLEDGRITREIKRGKKRRKWRHKLFDSENERVKEQ